MRHLPCLVLVLLVACGDSADTTSNWVAEIDTVGDTIVVRTVAGSVWDSTATLEPVFQIGELDGAEEYVFGSITGLAVDAAGALWICDGQVPAVRHYGLDGRYITTLGREGSGPGEYKKEAGGLAILRDGRILLADQGNSRFQLWSPDGQPAGIWELRTTFSTGNMEMTVLANGGLRVFTDTARFAYSIGHDFANFRPGSGDNDRRVLLNRYSPEGAKDTLLIPNWHYRTPQIEARLSHRGGGGISKMRVPFAAEEHWTFSPLGYFVSGVSTQYAVYLMRPDGVLRIERATEPVVVDPSEKANAEEIAVDEMRGMDPSWRWNGEPIPDTKPHFLSLITSEEGRIWVQVSQSGQRIPDDEIEEPAPELDGRRHPTRRWREPVAFDVFEPDGRYVGRVNAPRGFAVNPAPVIRGDTVWAVIRDELDVDRVGRFRIQVPQSARAR